MAKNHFYAQLQNCLPKCLPMKNSGKLNCKVRLRNDYTKIDGLRNVYIQITLNRKVKRIGLDFSVLEKDFNAVLQRVKSSNKFYKDYNLLIEKKLADINTIEVNYRLAGKIITLEDLDAELNNPTARIDFVKFFEAELEKQKNILKPGTYRQQLSVLSKIRTYKSQIYFYEINEQFVNDFKAYCKAKLKNTENTISTTIKSFKKYLHLAETTGIRCNISFSDIKNKSFKGNRTFLEFEEIQKLDEYWCSSFIPNIYKNILGRFLFSCFTGLRFADVSKLTEENFLGDYLVFTAEKTGKFQRIKINDTAKKYLYDNFFKINSTNEYTNRELKKIAKNCGISKRVTFHVSRHTFATNFLICGGRVEHLQKLLAHSKIEETMLYVGIVENHTNSQIMNMDDI